MALYKRGNTWWMNFWFDGHHVQRSTKCKNKRDAEAIERAYYMQLVKGEVGIEPKQLVPTFRDAVSDFLVWSKVEHSAKPNTYIRYKTSTIPLSRFFKNISLNRISSADIEKYKVWRSQQTLLPRGVNPRSGISAVKRSISNKLVAPATVNRELACLKKIFNCLVREDILISNPVSRVKFFNEDNLQMRFLTYAEEKVYLMACSQPLQDFAIMMLETGMRPDELRNLSVSHVYLEKHYVQVVKGKTKAARRRIPLTDRAYEVLMARLKNLNSEYVFPSERGLVKGENRLVKLNNAHYGALRRSNVDRFRIYDLRHTFATRQAEAGTDLVTLAALLGHSRLEMVMRYAPSLRKS